MIFDYDKCPECGYVNKKRPSVCPSCGCDLDEYRKELQEKEIRYNEEQEKKAQLAELEKQYEEGISLFASGHIDDAMVVFLKLGDFKDSAKFLEKCNQYYYDAAIEHFYSFPYLRDILLYLKNDDLDSDMKSDDVLITSKLKVEDYVASVFSSVDYHELNIVKTRFEDLKGFNESNLYLSYCLEAIKLYDNCEKEIKYEEAKKAIRNKDYNKAKELLTNLYSYKDAQKLLDKVDNLIAEKIAAEKAEKERLEDLERKKQRQIEARKRAIYEEEQRRKKKRDATETFFQVICLISPIVMTVIFAIILFSNSEQLSIIGSFTNWCTAWVTFTIAALITSIVLLKRRFREWEASDKSSRVASAVVAVIIAICSTFVFVGSSGLSSNFDPTTFITFRVTQKSTDVRHNTLYSIISLELTNNSDVEVSYILGEMNLYNGNNIVGSWNVYFNGQYEGGYTYTTSIEFPETTSSDLYNTPYSRLGITYRIYKMRFNGDYREYDFDGQVMTLKEGESSSNNISNTGDPLLDNVRNFAGLNAILPDNYENYYEGGNCYISSNYDDNEHYSFYIMFIVSDAYFDSFLTDFVSKLTNNGYTLRSKIVGEYEYVKDYTVIHFGDVNESFVWNGEESVKEYNYFNYYAYTV